MNIKDIVNRDIVNLTNCDQEPIHIPGSIQPHGFLVAFSDDYTIDFCSANSMLYIGATPEQILTKNIKDVFGDETGNEIISYVNPLKDDVSPLLIAFGTQKLSCIIHRSDNFWIAEFEAASPESPQQLSVFNQTVQFVKYMEQSQTLQQFCDKVAGEIRALTGYDRVMIYRFDKFYNGEVFAERKRDDIESFFGLHYPHTDIPVQARQLYIINLLRLIVDIHYEPVPLLTVDDKPGKNLNLSLSSLRSVSPIHIQYLANIGVAATLTISLVHKGRLWGLVACHHYSAKYIDHDTRISAQLQGHFLTSQIDVRQIAEEYNIAGNVNSALESLLSNISLHNRDSLQTIVSNPQLLNVCNASGVCILLNNIIYKNGLTPSDNNIQDISEWGFQHHPQYIFSTSKLVDEVPEAVNCSAAAGIIFFALSSMHTSCIIWFNAETSEEVKWAGEPDKAIIKDEKGLHPRNSFAIWKQVIKCQAREWMKPELLAATNFAYALQKNITLLLLTEEETRQRLLTEELKQSNAELENINWLSTHDLKEPLRKIQLFSSRLLITEGEQLSQTTSVALQKLNASANRMQKLIQDLTAYSKVRKTVSNFEEIRLDYFLQEVLQTLADDIEEKKLAINIQAGLPVIHSIPVLIHELFINLLRNAIKFRKEGESAVVNIASSNEVIAFETDEAAKLYYKIIVRDNGIGFENNYKNEIFRIFSRLNSSTSFEGSGIGLALCKKIMQIHRGHISADGKLNEGATFCLYFPADNEVYGNE